jgi:hypothetical protein
MIDHVREPEGAVQNGSSSSKPAQRRFSVERRQFTHQDRNMYPLTRQSIPSTVVSGYIQQSQQPKSQQRQQQQSHQLIEANPDVLIRDARQDMHQIRPSGYGQPPTYLQDQSYRAYGDQQLTVEEEEEEDAAIMKQEIKFEKQQDICSTRGAVQVVAQAEEIGRNTLACLDFQDESLGITDRNLDFAANHQRIAEEKAKQLQLATCSMFDLHSNELVSGYSYNNRAQKIVDKHQAEREQQSQQQQFQQPQSRLQQCYPDYLDQFNRSSPATFERNVEFSAQESASYPCPQPQCAVFALVPEDEVDKLMRQWTTLDASDFVQHGI